MRAAARRRHASIVVRFDAVLAKHDGSQLSTRELCAAVGVPDRTLAICYAEFLGMNPGGYVRLRRQEASSPPNSIEHPHFCSRVPGKITVNEKDQTGTNEGPVKAA